MFGHNGHNNDQTIRGREAAGGAGAQRGISFENNLAAYYLLLMLAQGSHEPLFGWPSDRRICLLWLQPPPFPTSDIFLSSSHVEAAYVQAKLSLQLSGAFDSDLADAVVKFTRQITERQAFVGVEDGRPWERPIDPECDRFVIAIGPTGPRKAEDLINRLCDTARRHASWDTFEETVAQGGEIADTLEIIRAHAAAGIVPDDTAEDSVNDSLLFRLLKCFRVCRHDFDVDGTDRQIALQLLRTRLLSSPDDAGIAWTALVEICGELAQDHGSINAVETRKELLSRGIKLKYAPDYRAEGESLRERTRDELDYIDDAIDCGTAGIIRIDRPVAGEIMAAASQAHVLLHGEPGVGKSWAIRQLVSTYTENPSQHPGQVLLIRAESLPVRSVRQAHEEMQLQHPLEEVLQHITIAGTNAIVFDGLDAARDENQATAIRKMIDGVVERTDWHVVVSIRTFDLEHSRHFRDLFDKVSEVDCTRIEVPRLAVAELEQSLAECPELLELYGEASAGFNELMLTPFNLALLGAIVRQRLVQGQSLQDLQRINVLVELLQEYWQERVARTELGDARARVVLDAGRQMLQTGELRVSRAGLRVSADEVEWLLSEGVFVCLNPPACDFLGFFHNIFVDFAATKWLVGQSEQTITDLLCDRQRVLFLRPAIRQLLEYTWTFARDRFWALYEAICGQGDLPAVWRILPAQVLAEQSPEREELDVMAQWVTEHGVGDWVRESLTYLFRALLASHPAPVPDRHRVWLELAYDIRSSLDGVLAGAILAYADQWTTSALQLHSSVLRLMNGIAQAAFERDGESSYVNDALRPKAAAIIARTFSGDPDTSREVLRSVVDSCHPLQCWQLADNVRSIVSADPAFAGELLARLLCHWETSQEQMAMGRSAILRLTTTLQNHWQGIWHGLREAYPELLHSSPVAATRVLLAVVQAIVDERSDRTGSDLPPAQTFDVNGQAALYRADYSSIWYDSSVAHDSREEIVEVFESWLVEVAQCRSRSGAALTDVFEVLYQGNQFALIWNVCLRAAAQAPEAIAAHVYPLVSSPVLMISLESKEYVVQALRVLYPYYTEDQRIQIELRILAFPETATDADQREMLESRRDALLRCIPDDLVATLDARNALDSQPPNGPTGGDEPTVQPGWVSSREIDDGDRWLATEGADTASPAYQCMKRYTDPVRAFVKPWHNRAPDVDSCREIFPQLIELEEALEEEERGTVHVAQHEYGRSLLAEAAEYITRNLEWANDDDVLTWAVERLMIAAEDPAPLPGQEQSDAQFDEHTHWSTRPRICAAAGLMNITARAGTLAPEVIEKLRMLSQDPLPAVRYQIAIHLVRLYTTQEALMWDLGRQFAENDASSTVIRGMLVHLIRRVVGLRPEAALRVIMATVDRADSLTKGSDVAAEGMAITAGIAVFIGNEEAQVQLDSLLTADRMDPVLVMGTITEIRGALIRDDSEPYEDAATIRRRAIDWYSAVARRALQELNEWQEQCPDSRNAPEREIERARALLGLIDAVASQVYFAADLMQGQSQAEQSTVTDAQRLRLLDETQELLQLLASARHPSIIYHLIELLDGVVHLAPGKIIPLLEEVCGGRGEVQLLHMEDSVVRRVVNIIEVVMADHRDMIVEDEQVSASVIGILDAFVSVGWPEAQQLLLRLEQLVR